MKHGTTRGMQRRLPKLRKKPFRNSVQLAVKSKPQGRLPAGNRDMNETIQRPKQIRPGFTTIRCWKCGNGYLIETAPTSEERSRGWVLAWLGLALALGNFAYQLFGSEQWGVALERTWFQCVALFAVWWVGRLVGQGPTKN